MNEGLNLEDLKDILLTIKKLKELKSNSKWFKEMKKKFKKSFCHENSLTMAFNNGAGSVFDLIDDLIEEENHFIQEFSRVSAEVEETNK